MRNGRAEVEVIMILLDSSNITQWPEMKKLMGDMAGVGS